MINFSKIKTALILLLAMPLGSAYADNPQYSQNYNSPLLIAPSFAGNSLGSRAYLTYRDQWAKLPGSYVTYAVGIDNNFYAINSGFGLTAVYDVAGTAGMGTTSATALYSYRFNFTEDWRIRPGISFSYSQRALNRRAIWGDQISITGIDETTIEATPAPYYYFDAASSVVVYNRQMWFGLSANNLMRPNRSFGRQSSKAPIEWLQFGGYNIPMTSRVGRPAEIITLHYLLRATAIQQQMEVGINWYRAPLLMGFGYRGLPPDGVDALIVTVGVAFNNIAFGYSYDFTVSKLGAATGGSHEITLRIEFNEGGKNQQRSEIPCPDVVRFRMFGDKESFR